MLPWDKKFINEYIPKNPKTIFYSDGSSNVQNVCENIIRNFLDQIINPGISNKDLYQISSPNLLCLKCEDDEKIYSDWKTQKSKGVYASQVDECEGFIYFRGWKDSGWWI